MKEINWIDLAPWIAIAITLIISIIVPLLTQIANNSFQLKIRQLDEKNKMTEAKINAFTAFTCDVGACIACSDPESAQLAGASTQKMYLFLPEENWEKLDELYHHIRKYEWSLAEPLLADLSKVASKLLNEQNNKSRKVGKVKSK